jgi:hypothetical protein
MARMTEAAYDEFVERSLDAIAEAEDDGRGARAEKIRRDMERTEHQQRRYAEMDGLLAG